jgi:hypothetical protein
MAEHQSFLPRDRAYARCALHMLLVLDESSGGPTLWERCKSETVAADGMPSSEPLTVIVAERLGGCPGRGRFEALPLSDVLAETQRTPLAARLAELEARRAARADRSLASSRAGCTINGKARWPTAANSSA